MYLGLQSITLSLNIGSFKNNIGQHVVKHPKPLLKSRCLHMFTLQKNNKLKDYGMGLFFPLLFQMHAFSLSKKVNNFEKYIFKMSYIATYWCICHTFLLKLLSTYGLAVITICKGKFYFRYKAKFKKKIPKEDAMLLYYLRIGCCFSFFSAKPIVIKSIKTWIHFVCRGRNACATYCFYGLLCRMSPIL